MLQTCDWNYVLRNYNKVHDGTCLIQCLNELLTGEQSDNLYLIRKLLSSFTFDTSVSEEGIVNDAKRYLKTSNVITNNSGMYAQTFLNLLECLQTEGYLHSDTIYIVRGSSIMQNEKDLDDQFCHVFIQSELNTKYKTIYTVNIDNVYADTTVIDLVNQKIFIGDKHISKNSGLLDTTIQYIDNI